MARYIDVEGYRKLFDEEYKETRKLISEGETHLDNLAEGFSEATRVLDMLPTADVVPKSEVDSEIKVWQELYANTVSKWEKAYEELEIKLARLNAVMKEMDEQRAYTIDMLAESLENAKAEVARKIFEDIEAHFDKRIAFYQDMRFRACSVGKDEEVKYANTMITNLTIYKEEIAELKKKYTGEK